MKFLVDQNLPPALARWLTAQGHASQHVTDVQMTDSHDWDIWKYAAQNEYVIISKDEDFSTLVYFDANPVQVVWIQLGNCRKQQLLEVFESVLPEVIERIGNGEVLIEVL